MALYKLTLTEYTCTCIVSEGGKCVVCNLQNGRHIADVQPPVHIDKFSEDTINRRFIRPDMNTNSY